MEADHSTPRGIMRYDHAANAVSHSLTSLPLAWPAGPLAGCGGAVVVAPGLDLGRAGAVAVARAVRGAGIPAARAPVCAGTGTPARTRAAGVADHRRWPLRRHPGDAGIAGRLRCQGHVLRGRRTRRAAA
ncbi:hypothetical protein XHV734_0991 [Xanthomonas hortorum pv. vitians]|nr:hypothetical protein XHV734_0991 [Xanthomonas hortorum pv. vitians]